MKACRICTVLILFLLAQGAAAGQWNTLSSGSLFRDADNQVNDGLGSGLQYEFDRESGHWVKFVTATQFIDASQNQAYMAGGGVARRLPFTSGKHSLRMDIGVIACAMQRPDFDDQDTVLAAVPTFSVGSRNIAVNLSYVNNSQYHVGHVWVLQLKVAQKAFWQ